MTTDEELLGMSNEEFREYSNNLLKERKSKVKYLKKKAVLKQKIAKKKKTLLSKAGKRISRKFARAFRFR